MELGAAGSRALEAAKRLTEDEASFMPEGPAREYAGLERAETGGVVLPQATAEPEMSAADKAWADQMKDIFETYDADGDGGISEEELGALLRAISGDFSKKNVTKLFKEADHNADGKICFGEFINWLMKPAVDSLGRAVVCYSQAFKPLFHAFDRDDTGFISKENFEECHCLMQGALRLAGEEDDVAHKANPLSLQKDHEEAFALMNKDGSGAITFFEFVDWMKGHVPPGMCPEELKVFNTSLATMLTDTFATIALATSGDIREDQSYVLEDALQKLVESTQALRGAIRDKTVVEKSAWTEPPAGLSVERLKRRHLSMAPVNMQRVSKMSWKILCVPMQGDYEDPEARIWLAEILRNVEWKSGKATAEAPEYYAYDRQNLSWAVVSKDGTQQFQDILAKLSPGIGVFCLLKTEANLGIKISWLGIQSALEASVDKGFITQEQLSKLNEYMRGFARKQVECPGSEEARTKAADEYLSASVSMRPRNVMATLSKLGIVGSDPVWEDFEAH